MKELKLWDVKGFIQDYTIRKWQDPNLSLLGTKDYALKHWALSFQEHNHMDSHGRATY